MEDNSLGYLYIYYDGCCSDLGVLYLEEVIGVFIIKVILCYFGSTNMKCSV